MDFEDFDDVDIDSSATQLRRPLNKHSVYNSKITRPGTASLETINRSTTSLLHAHKDTPPPVPTKDSKHTPSSSPQRKKQMVKPAYSPSKKLKQLRQRKDEPFDISTLNDSDDELDESTIIFDVPLSQSLVQLSQNQKLITPKLMSIASDSTRQSSLMSYDHAAHDFNSDFELDLQEEALKITCEYSQSKAVLATQESAMRRHILSQLERPQGIDQNNSPSSGLKDKYLTNTRPTHLPPKDRTESLKHSREVEELKQRAIREELRLEKLRLKEIERRQKIKDEDLVTWEKEIIPDFASKIKSSSTRELWWRGIPAKLRKWIWVELVEQKSMKPSIVQALRARANTLIKANSPTVKKIRDEVQKVFPDLGVFQKDGSLHNDLVAILTMYYQHANSYDPTLTSLSAVLLYNIQVVDETFVTLCGLMQRPLLKMMYTGSTDAFTKESQSFLRTFAKKNTRLYTHIHETIKMKPDTYLMPLLKPVFSNLLSMEVSSSIMDVYIFEGDAFLWRCVLGIFEKIGYRLYGNEAEIMNVIGWDALSKLNNGESSGVWYKYLEVGDEVEFLETVRSVLKKLPTTAS